MAGALQHSRIKAKENEPSKAKEKHAARTVSKEQKVKAKANVGNVDKQDTLHAIVHTKVKEVSPTACKTIHSGEMATGMIGTKHGDKITKSGTQDMLRACPATRTP